MYYMSYGHANSLQKMSSAAFETLIKARRGVFSCFPTGFILVPILTNVVMDERVLSDQRYGACELVQNHSVAKDSVLVSEEGDCNPTMLFDQNPQAVFAVRATLHTTPSTARPSRRACSLLLFPLSGMQN
jgi:hypothetical protein